MLNEKQVLAIIPARGGSKGVPRKNLRVVKGKSLLARTIECAQASPFIDKIIVSSEDEEIISAAKQAGADVPFVRPLALAQDETSGIEPVLHALTQLPYYDYLVVLQVTSPLRLSTDIDACLQLCVNKNAPACVSVYETDVNPHWMFTLKDNQVLTKLLANAMPARRQELPAAYALNGAVYVAKTDWFLQHKSFFSSETVGYVMPKDRSLDIDSEWDFHLLETYMNHQRE